jgi:integrase
MASISRITTHKGTVRWQARWREPGLSGKPPRSKRRNFTSQKEAKAYAARMAEERELRGVGDPHRHSTGEYLRRWLAYLHERGDHAPTTLAGYERHAGIAAHHIGHIPLAKLGAHDLDRLYATLRRHGGRPRADGRSAPALSPQSVLHVHRLLHTALGQARKWKLIAYNPATDATAPTVPFQQARGFTAAEIERLLELVRSDPELTAMVALLLITGMRRSEVLGLALDAVDFEAGTVSVRRTVTEVRGKAVLREVPKSKSAQRTLSIPPEVVALLRVQKARVLEQALLWGAEYSREPMFLFPGLAGIPMRPMAVTERLRQLCRRAKITDVQPVHGWRHATGTLLVAGGTDVKTAQVRLGHSSPVITLRLYTDVVSENDRTAAERLARHLTPKNKT